MNNVKLTLKSFFLMLVILQLSSCVPSLPIGVWKSDEPNIIIFIDRTYEPPRDIRITNRIRYVGLYSTNDETVKLFMMFSPSPHFMLFKIDFLENGNVRRGELLSSGEWSRQRGELHYRIVDFPAFGLEIGDTIIFRRITDYEPPNFDEWFP